MSKGAKDKCHPNDLVQIPPGTNRKLLTVSLQGVSVQMLSSDGFKHDCCFFRPRSFLIFFLSIYIFIHFLLPFFVSFTSFVLYRFLLIFLLSPSLSLLIAQLILCLFDLQFGQKKQKKNLQHLKSSHVYINFSLFCYS